MARGKLSKAISGAISAPSISLQEYKQQLRTLEATKYKPQTYIPLSPAFNKAIGLPGLPVGQITILRGHTDTGKTLALLEAMKQCQAMGILPVLIVTEMKWSWDHVVEMGIDAYPVSNDDGEFMGYDGFFLYEDQSKLHTIEDVAGYIFKRLKDQKDGLLPYDLCFMWDSIGSVPCKQSIESENNNNMWNAGAISREFRGKLNQMILSSRKESSKYTNTLICTNKIWVEAGQVFGELPTVKNNGGEAMASDSVLMVTFGSVTKSGTNKIDTKRQNQNIIYAKRTRVTVDKNHLTGISAHGKVIATPHGFIEDSKESIEEYRAEYSDFWLEKLKTQNVEFAFEEEKPE